MSSLLAAVIGAFFFAFPLRAQIRRGSLVVSVASNRGDYVVIGAESRTSRFIGNFVDDRSCKVISLGGDTIFYETGANYLDALQGESWNSNGTARAIYGMSREHDALSLSIAWRNRALRWFSLQSEQDMRTIATGPGGMFVNVGFINFDKQGSMSIHGVEISYNATTHTLTSTPVTQIPGHMGVTGLATDLVQEFIDGKTDRAVTALRPVNMVRPIGADFGEDVRFVRAAINFAIDNATGKDKSALGGNIDIAVIRNDRTVEWVARKSWCSQEDLQPTVSTKIK